MGTFPYRTMYNLLSNNTTLRISKDSIIELDLFVTNILIDVIRSAETIASRNNKRTINRGDIIASIANVITNKYREIYGV